jgi:hypothetical protein
MEYTIENERLNNIVFNFLESYFKNEEINYTHPYDGYEDEDGDEVEGENPNVIEYYIGDYDEDKLLFRLYFKGYWTGTNATADKRRNESPIISIMDENLEDTLDGMFNDEIWANGFKIWFKRKLDIDINRIR